MLEPGEVGGLLVMQRVGYMTKRSIGQFLSGMQGDTVKSVSGKPATRESQRRGKDKWNWLSRFGSFAELALRS
jgi:hypothetical protein